MRSRCLVIDASVIRSAGQAKQSEPVSDLCRETLKSVLNICHQVVLTEPIRSEWKRHKSRFSRKWWVSMYARRKVQDVNSEKINVDTTGLSSSDQNAIEKDMCLIEAALSADRIILSRDEAFPRALAKTRDGECLLKSVRWINPVVQGPEVLKTL